jgi:hypothetical protein
VGDIKNGSTECSTQRYEVIRDFFNRFEAPLIYTPGDNEWTDCHRKNNGAYEPQERLTKIRELFFKQKNSFGKRTIPLEHQPSVQPEFSAYIENTRWIQNDVLFVTLHQVGSNNNKDPDIVGAISEFQLRNKANMAWLQSAFQLAKQRQSQAIVIAMQSDSFDAYIPKDSGYTEFNTTIAQLSREFDKPVLIIQGDSHRYVLNQPFKDSRGVVSNLWRLVVPGANLVEAVQITINTDASNASQTFQFKKYGIE